MLWDFDRIEKWTVSFDVITPISYNEERIIEEKESYLERRYFSQENTNITATKMRERTIEKIMEKLL